MILPRPISSIVLKAWVAATFIAAAASGQSQIKLERPPVLGEAESQARGQALVADLLSRAPEPSIRTNTLRIENDEGRRSEISVRFETVVSATHWLAIYEVMPGQGLRAKLTIENRPGESAAVYRIEDPSPRVLAGAQTMTPFAGSDFWVADLGLEFLRWPGQKVTKREMRKGQACEVLESTHPHPAREGYSRVVSWVDSDTGGIVHADAYDSSGKVFKRFEPSEIQKSGGRWQVKEIKMTNRRTGSRSWVVFDLRD